MSHKGTAIITGGSSGIGAEYARQLAEKGYSILITGRRENKLKNLCEEISVKYGVTCDYQIAELSDPVELLALEKNISQLENPAILINNAGFGTGREFVDLSPDELEAMIQVHNTASVRLSRAIIPKMLELGQGSIIYVSSLASLIPGSMDPLYSATKIFLNYLARSLDICYRDRGIAVQSLLPGFTTSDFHEKMGQKEQYYSQFKFMSAEKVVKISLKYLKRKKVLIIPGIRNRLINFILKIIPWSLINFILKTKMKDKTN